MIKNYSLNIHRPSKCFVQDIPLGEVIPKVVYQTFPSKSLPQELEANIAKLKEANPEWEFKLFDDADVYDFIANNFQNLLGFYTSIDPTYGAAKADFFRYLIIYKLGGVYLDIKSTLSKPLNEIVRNDTKYVLAYWNEKSYGIHAEISNINGEYQQWHVISVAGHPFLKETINAVCNNIKVYNPFLHGKSTRAILRVTGPIAYSIAIERIIKQWPYTVGYDNDIGLVYSVYNNGNRNDLVHRVKFKSHYVSSIMPMIKQNYLIEFMYIFVWRIIYKMRSFKISKIFFLAN